jgi:hypothetical protein
MVDLKQIREQNERYNIFSIGDCIVNDIGCKAVIIAVNSVQIEDDYNPVYIDKFIGYTVRFFSGNKDDITLDELMCWVKIIKR